MFKKKIYYKNLQDYSFNVSQRYEPPFSLRTYINAKLFSVSLNNTEKMDREKQIELKTND